MLVWLIKQVMLEMLKIFIQVKLFLKQCVRKFILVSNLANTPCLTMQSCKIINILTVIERTRLHFNEIFLLSKTICVFIKASNFPQVPDYGSYEETSIGARI